LTRLQETINTFTATANAWPAGGCNIFDRGIFLPAAVAVDRHLYQKSARSGVPGAKSKSGAKR
jgi:hypothetical protein